MEIESIVKQVKYNCNISDARYWGNYSICGLLMRLRELYMQEHGIGSGQSVSKNDIMDWIAEREALWEVLESAAFEDIDIDGHKYEPFDSSGINQALNKHGLIYSGGYGMFGKPMFFLARLKFMSHVSAYGIYYSDSEYCRDLSTSMAMVQGQNIFVRLEPLRAFLWEKVSELQCGKSRAALREAFGHYGISDKQFLSLSQQEAQEKGSQAVATVCQDVAEMIALHELGEAAENEIAPLWLDILESATDRLTEFYLRAIKDVLADTTLQGPLKLVISNESKPLVHFYIAFLDGLRKELFPEVIDAYKDFADTGNRALLEQARISGYTRLDNIRKEILDIWDNTESSQCIESFIKSRFKRG